MFSNHRSAGIAGVETAPTTTRLPTGPPHDLLPSGYEHDQVMRLKVYSADSVKESTTSNESDFYLKAWVRIWP